MVELQVNPVGFNNWSGLFDLLKESFAYMDGRIDPPSSFHQLDVNSLEVKAKQENLVVAEQDGQLIACAFFKPLNDAIYIGKVAVTDKYRQQGLARKMVMQIEQSAVE